ncbi:MAG: hypothetical protein LC792_15490, partial [Actinobacteria bacterium]|nr:hypothetical protein [Actinomycetota bacterium]
SVGAPGAYDYGMLRNAWLMHLVTDWMGDDAIITAVDDRITGFNIIGDLTRLSGRVESIDETGEWPELVITVEATNQREERTAGGTIHVRLPSRVRGLAKYPEPPADQGLLPGMVVPEEGPWAR